MTGSGFVHLHNHTTYSMLDGAQRLDEVCGRAAGDGQSALAITDHGNLFGVLEFAREAKKHSVRPIIGIEAYVAPGSRFDRGGAPAGGVRQKPVPSGWSATPPGTPFPARRLGEDSRAVLREAGYSDAGIDAMAAGGATLLAD